MVGPIQPYAVAAADRFGRLFPEAPAATQNKMNPAALGQLAWSMRHNETPIPIDLRQGHAPPPIAITYFGQFLAHDLTFDSTPLREAGYREPISIQNNRTPWLDLDHLFGDGPRSSRHAHLYESDDACFRVGYPPFGGEPFDVPFGLDGGLALVDERNGENVIVRQIHALFLKLHNVAVRELPAIMPSRERFERARDRVRRQYQWLVHNWYLREICHPEVYDAVVQGNDCRFDWKKDGFAIPVEFSLAAMRFGHSMVRPAYRLNRLSSEEGGSGLNPLADLFGMKNNAPLGSHLKIDWSLLSNDGAMSIDTALVEPLFHIPDEHLGHSTTRIPHPPNALALRTLLRGAATRLPTGQQVRDALGERPIADTPSEYESDPWDPLRSVGLAEETPLWYYILLEAQLDPDCVGSTLGRVGSRIVAEVIEGSLRFDPTSFPERRGRDRAANAWPIADCGEISVRTLRDVALVVAV